MTHRNGSQNSFRVGRSTYKRPEIRSSPRSAHALPTDVDILLDAALDGDGEAAVCLAAAAVGFDAELRRALDRSRDSRWGLLRRRLCEALGKDGAMQEAVAEHGAMVMLGMLARRLAESNRRRAHKPEEGK